MNLSVRSSRIIQLAICCVALIVLFSVLIKPAAPQNATRIVWSESHLFVTLFPGEAVSRSVQFTSAADLDQLTIGVVPAIAAFMHVDPLSLETVVGNQPQPIQLLFQAPTTAVVGTYEGTIHVRRGTATLPDTLKVTVSVASQSFSNSSLGLDMRFPLGWTAREAGGATVFSNVTQSSEISEETLATESFFEIRRLGNAAGTIGPLPANPNNLPIEQWFDSYFANGGSSPLLSREVVTVGGRPAVRIEVSGIGQSVHYYIGQGTAVIEVTYGLFTPRFVGEYEAMLGSMSFQ